MEDRYIIREISENQKDNTIELILSMNSFTEEEEEQQEQEQEALVLHYNNEYPPEDYIDPSSQEDNIYLYCTDL